MAQFKLDRFTYKYRNDWTSGVAYALDDIVTVNGNVYYCTRAHTSNEDFYFDFLYDFTYPAPYSASDNINAAFDFSAVAGGENTTVDGTGIQFQILRTGDKYTVTLTDGGRNYVSKEYFKVPGDQLGGVRGVNDAIVTVATVDNVTQNNLVVPGVVQSLTISGTASTTKWELMSEGYSWRGSWQPSTSVTGTDENGNDVITITPNLYYINDLVEREGNIYRCTQGHQALVDNDFGLSQNLQYWTLHVFGSHWEGDWTGLTAFQVGDVVRAGGTVWRCTTAHTSGTNVAGLAGDQNNWQQITTSDDWLNEWQSTQNYRPNDIVRYGGYLYRCNSQHTSTNEFENELDTEGWWDLVVPGIEYKGTWTAPTAHAEGGVANTTKWKLGDLIRYSQEVYVCSQTHTVTGTDVETDDPLFKDYASNWQLYVAGMAYEDQWDETVNYQPGDIVMYGGYTYYCKTFNFAANPTTEINDWEILSEWYNFKNDWNAVEVYKVGDVVRNNGYLYWAVTDNTGEKPDNGQVDTIKVTVGNPGSGNRYYWDGNLHPDQTFIRGNTYVFDQSHPSNDGHPIYPADTENGFLNTGDGGNELFVGVQTTYILDDQIIDTLENYNAGFNAATIRQTRVKIEPDAPATFYFACYNHLNMSGSQVISVSGSTYWDLLMPGVSFRGPWDDFNTDSSINLYELGDVALWAGTAYQCIRSHRSDAIDSRPDVDARKDIPVYWKVYVQGIRTNVLARPGDIKSFSADSNIRVPIGDLGTVLKGLPKTNADSSLGQAPTWDLLGKSTKNYYVSLNGVDAPDKGASKENPFRTVKYALDYILADEATRAPATVFVATGEFEEQLPLKVPSNVAVVGDELRSTRIKPRAGDEGRDMFHVRNGCGIRNMTLSGLVGTLGSPNEFGTRRPVGGGPSFVSLDPGTGPTDETVWVTNKSTYVQNVSTFGTACVGMKVDGGLHNGGNRSIVANDFTQVISGGIGMWIANGGLSELVSVFTYYCHIGYLSESGGKIRATNGNNSYGDFGSVAEGYDLLETPITANVNNRDNEASIANVLTDLDEQIYFFGYSHAGQSYTRADVDAFSGTGSNLEAEFKEFRNKALSQVRVLDPGDSTTPGGRGFSITTGQAQGGTASGTIILSATDTVEDSSGVYDGKRIFITQGRGKGQYGYIQSYDPSTKIAYVLRESDGLSGWDHWIPGTPIEANLGDTAFYQIEPRVEFNKPPFATQSINVNTPLDYSSVVYGGGRYVAVAQSSFGSPGTAQFIYSTDGTSWSSGNIDGQNVPQNSGTWSWQDIDYGGGKFVAVAREGIVAVSSDGENWTCYEVTNDSSTVTTRHIAYGDNPTIEQTFKVTISVPGDNPVYHFDSAVNTAPDIAVVEGNTYTFQQNDTSNIGCPIYFSTTPEGINGGGSEFTEGVKYFLNNVQVSDLQAYAAGFNAANTRKVVWTVPNSLVGTNLYYVNYNSTGSGVQTDSSYAVVRVDGRSEWLVTADGSPEYFQSLDGGNTWTLGNLPSYQSYDGGVKAMAYGAGKFVAVSGDWDSSKQRIYTKTPGNTDWEENFEQTTNMSNMTSLEFGNNIFIGTVAGSDSVWINPNGGDGTFYEQTSVLPTTGNWTVGYGQGVYVAFKPNTNEFAISENGILWEAKTLPTSANWTTIGIGTPNNSNKFVLLGSGNPLQGSGEVNAVVVQAGRRPFARMFVRNTRASEFWIYDPGSGYEQDLANTVNNAVITFGRNTDDDADVYTIDGVENPELTLTEGRKYVYNLSDTSLTNYGGAVVEGEVEDNPHPFLFYSDAAKTTVYEDNVIYRLGTTIVSRARYLADFADTLTRSIEIEVQYDAPSTLYYGSSEDAGVQTITIEETDDLSMTVSDPLATADPFVKLRIANGVLPQPSFRNRGTKFRSATASVTGDGFADSFQVGNKIKVTDLTREPGPGANLQVAGIDGVIYLVTKVTNITGTEPSLSATIQISPTMGVDESPTHDTSITIRESYSQVRLTFHDFLDIGTGNKNSTRYPLRYLEGYTDADADTVKQNQETDFSDGGRVFYSSTDQDGNFRVGELFEVEQASGIITINADQFDLSGLSELSLGGVTLGGTGAVIREFSIDPLFTANSDSIVPTQKAVAAYVKSRITGGGSSVNVNKVTAGVITSGDSGQGLETTDGSTIQMKAKVSFEGGVGGDMAARAFFAFGTDVAISDDFGGTDEGGGDYQDGYGA